MPFLRDSALLPLSRLVSVLEPHSRAAANSARSSRMEKRRRTAEGQAAAEEGWLASLDRVEEIQEELEDINDEVASRVLQLECEVHPPQPPPQR